MKSPTIVPAKKLHNFGPGGIKCSCCTPYSSGKKNRRLSNRAIRREGKLSLRFAFED